MDHHEALVQLLFDFCRVNDPLRDLGLIEGRLDPLLDILPESGLHEFGDFLAKNAVAVTDGEEVCASVLAKMRQY